jgi:hypothetical protein
LLGFPHSTRMYTHTETHAHAGRSMASWRHKRRVDGLMDGWIESHVKLHNVGVRPIHVFSPSEMHTHGHAPRRRRALGHSFLASHRVVHGRRGTVARVPGAAWGHVTAARLDLADGASARAAAVRLPWQHGYSGEPHAHTAVPAGARALCRRAGRWGGLTGERRCLIARQGVLMFVLECAGRSARPRTYGR